MNNLISWIKSNKVPAILIGVLALLAFGKMQRMPIPLSKTLNTYNASDSVGVTQESMMYNNKMMPTLGMGGGAAPRMDVANRKVVTNSYLSLLVKDVRATIDSVKTYVQGLGGFVVNSSINTPEGLSTGDVTVRVPSKNLSDALNFFRTNSVKVVTENINGNDITDQFMDTEERLNTLQATKAKYEEILNTTNDVEQILIINDRIINIQDQIDSLKGQLKYMTETSESVLITVYLSTDELELPFAPEERWNPGVVFKYAVRGLVADARGLAGSLIWIAVYSVVWVPLLLIVLAIKKHWKKSSPAQTQQN